MTELAPTETRVSTAGFDTGVAGITPPSNPDRRGVFLADVVVELGLADQETIDLALKAAQETEISLERYLLQSGILDEDGLSRAIAERNGLDHVDLGQFEVDMDAAEMVARSAAQRYNAVPVAFASDGALIVAVQDPFDTLGISDIEVMTRSEVRPAIATASALADLIERLPDRAASRLPAVERIVEEDAAGAAPNSEDGPRSVDSPVVEEAPVEQDMGTIGHFEAVEQVGDDRADASPDARDLMISVGPPTAEEEPVPMPPVAEEPITSVGPPVFEEPAVEEDLGVNGHFEMAQPVEEEPAEDEREESRSDVEPEVELERRPGPDPMLEADPASDSKDADAGELGETETSETEPELELVRFAEVEPALEVVDFDHAPELVQFPGRDSDSESDPEPAAQANGIAGLEDEIGSLQETARRADELASTVERRIDELKNADDRVAQLEADLLSAQQRVGELEEQVSGVDTLAEELRATTAKLEEVNRVLEGSVR
jgi:hypothetical protein